MEEKGLMPHQSTVWMLNTTTKAPTVRRFKIQSVSAERSHSVLLIKISATV